MTDMLVRLYDLPPLHPALEAQTALGIDIRRGIPAEKHHVKAWVREHFNQFWENECDVAFGHLPVACFLAVQDTQLIGFSCYDVVRRAFFGPIGVSQAARGHGTGNTLLLATLHDMYAQGYAYGIIAGVGPIHFYERTVGAFVIPGSQPGVYRGMLRVEGDPEI
jgi:GNAT superfamily N-acetyltransferase